MYPLKLIDRNGNFKGKIEENLNLAAVSSPVAVVSIIGGQSSGKSTLLNHVFGCKFQEMNAAEGRFQTTKGIWVAKTTEQQGCTLVIDTEGSDGKEQEGDENFERQTALFAIAISNIVIVNMMCTDLGRNKGAGWPLLRTAIEVMLRRFKTSHKVTLLFVLRDKTDSPFEVLKDQLMGEVQKLLNEVLGHQAQGNAALDHLITVHVMRTSHYEHKREDFLSDVDDLRKWIFNRTTSGEDVAERIPASGFTNFAEKIWDNIKKDKDLNLPNYRIMVAEVRCNLIAKEKLEFFCKNKTWLQIKKDVESGIVVQGFGKSISSLIDDYLSQYDEEAQHYCETKRTEISEKLIENLLQVVEPTYLSVVVQMKNAIVEKFYESAGEELKSNGELKDTKLCNFITEFHNQHEDLAIKQANWNRATEQLTQLESEITRNIERVGNLNIHLKGKQQRREFWLKVALIASRSILTVGLAAASAFIPGMGIAASAGPIVAAASAAITPTLQNLEDIIKLLTENQEKGSL